MTSANQRCGGPVSRRNFLQVGTLGLSGLSLADMYRLRAAAESANVAGPDPETSVIFIWLPGGPPHMETYDMKPDAPSDYRGAFNPIHTAASGLDICEHLPLQAKTAGRFNIIRSIAHKFADHGGGHKRFLTGRDPKTPTGFVNDAPAAATIVSKMREHRKVGVPNYIVGANSGRHKVDVYSFGAAYLGPSYTAFTVPGDPSSEKFEIQNLGLSKDMANRLDDRKTLLGSLDRLRRDVDASGAMSAMDEFNSRAVDMLTSPACREAFDLSRESPKLREKYGLHSWGQRALMARRLVEAGSSFVTMVMENPYQSGIPYASDGVYNWDSHAVNCHLFNDALNRMPIYDRAISTLIDDLYDRGLDKKVMLVVTGEFGRTPRITYAKDRPGRDHWPQAMSVLVSGGMRTGQVIGSTNAKGEHPKDRPLTPNDLWATIYRHLGIDTEHAFPDHAGRPMPILPFGEPIEELL